MDETVLLVVITEQGENRNQYEKQRNIFGFPHGFACRGPECSSRQNRRARHDRTRRWSPTPSAEPSPPNTNCACWLRPTPPPLNPAPSVPCCGAMIAMTS